MFLVEYADSQIIIEVVRRADSRYKSKGEPRGFDVVLGCGMRLKKNKDNSRLSDW